LCIWTTFSLSIHPWHWGCFYVLAAVNMRVQVTLWHIDFISFEYVANVGLLNDVLILFLIFLRVVLGIEFRTSHLLGKCSTTEKTRGVSQWIQHVPSKHKALHSNASTTKKVVDGRNGHSHLGRRAITKDGFSSSGSQTSDWKWLRAKPKTTVFWL
jgi:hypothetical protein